MDTPDISEVTDATEDIEDNAAETLTREELEVFNDHITSVSTALLDVESQDYFHKFIHTEENLNIIRSFITDKQNRSLIVSKLEEFSKPIDESKEDMDKDTKDSTQDTIQTGDSDSKSIVSITLDLKVTYRGADSQSIAFIKRQNVTVIDLQKGRKRIGKQLQVFNLGYAGEEIDLFRLANIYIDNGLIPLFSSYKAKKSTGENNIEHLEDIEKLLAKLRLEFTHCTQDQISLEVKLSIPSKISAKVELAKEEGREITADDFEEELKDQNFIGSLKKCIKGWNQEIQKITYMNTDFPIDSILTEITFWKSRMDTLKNIEDQLVSPEVMLVFLLLKKDTNTSKLIINFFSFF